MRTENPMRTDKSGKIGKFMRTGKSGKIGKSMGKAKRIMAGLAAACALLFAACVGQGEAEPVYTPAETISMEEIPEYSGSPHVEINNNEPEFTEDELVTESYEHYSELDSLNRCGVAEACVGTDLMPVEERGEIWMVKPTGWHSSRYADVDGESLYNRCHLIAHQLAGEDANEKNLITGTRYMNTEGMQEYENMVADYVRETDNHVMYRVTPVFEGNNLVASGVQMEAESVEDGGEGVSFNVYCYNVQDGFEIDYATGENHRAPETETAEGKAAEGASGEGTEGQDKNGAAAENVYIVNKNTGKFHRPDCSGVSDVKPRNKRKYTGSREKLIEQGYEPCGMCKP